MRIKAKCRPGRGDVDTRAIIKDVIDNWDDIQSQLKTDYSEQEQQVIRDHFNNLLEDHNDLGDAIFGTKDDFEDLIATIDEEELKAFTGELIKNEALETT